MKFDLLAVKHIINLNTSIHVEIEYVYEDHGANLMHYNIISKKPEQYQVLCPRDAHLAIKGELSLESVQEIINNINNRGW